MISMNTPLRVSLIVCALLILLFNGPLFDAQVEVFGWARDL